MNEEDKKKEELGQTPPSPMGAMGQPPVGSSMQPGSQPAQTAGQPVTPKQVKPSSRGSGFSGIKRIIGASKGSRLGETISGRLQSAGELARSGTAQSREAFQSEAGKQQEEAQKQFKTGMGAISGISQAGAVQSGQLGQISQNITPEQQQAFQGLVTGKYTGPTGLKDVEQLKAKAAEAESLGKLAGSQYGRQELLRQQFAQRGGYGAKQSALDALILGKTGGGQLAQARSGLMGLEEGVKEAEVGAQQTAKAIQQERAGYGKELLGGLEKEVSGISGQISERQKKLAEARKSEYKSVLDALESGEVSEENPELIKKLEKAGIKEGSYLGGISRQDLESYLTQSEAPTLASTASQTEMAKMKALEQLGGGAAASKISPMIGQFAGKEKQFGTYDPNKAVEFKKEGEESSLAKKLSGEKGDIQQKFTAAKNKEDTNQSVANLVSQFRDSAQNLNHGQRNFLASKGILALEGSHGNKVDWAKYSPQTGGLVPVHPDGLVGAYAKEAETARTERKAHEEKLGKQLKIKRKSK